MAPKAKKGPKQLQTLASLAALQATYKAASRRHGAPMLKAVTERIEDQTNLVKPLTKITLAGPTVTSGVVRAVCECLAGYPSIKNLSCFGCSLGDQGLLALSALLKASLDKWYKGSKLRLLEITNDGAGFPAERWPERLLGHMRGDGGAGGATMATHGAGYEMPSLLLGGTQRVTTETVQHAAPEGALELDMSDVERRFSCLFATSSKHTAVTYQQLEDPLAGLAPSLAGGPPPPLCSFSPLALKEFSLALSAQPLLLQVLSLDHNHLGDAGAAILAAGLRRCGTLKQLSMAHCGIGAVGAAALSATLEPDGLTSVSALQPKYQVVNLSFNPLGAAGLAALCPGLARCGTLRVVQLSGIGVTDDHLEELQALADACSANPVIEQVDLDANFIGDRGAEIFLPMLSASPQMRRFRISDRVSRAIGEQIGAALRANFPAKKKRPKSATKK